MQSAEKKQLNYKALRNNDLGVTNDRWITVGFRCDPQVQTRLVKESTRLERENRVGRSGEVGQLLRRIVEEWLAGRVYAPPATPPHIVEFGEWLAGIDAEDRPKVREYGELLKAQREDRIRSKKRR